MAVRVDFDEVSEEYLDFIGDLHRYTVEVKIILDSEADSLASDPDYNPIEKALEVLDSRASDHYSQTSDNKKAADLVTEDSRELRDLYESLEVPVMTAMVAEDYDFEPSVYEKDWVQDRAEGLEEFASNLAQTY